MFLSPAKLHYYQLKIKTTTIFQEFDDLTSPKAVSLIHPINETLLMRMNVLCRPYVVSGKKCWSGLHCKIADIEKIERTLLDHTPQVGLKTHRECTDSTYKSPEI